MSLGVYSITKPPMFPCGNTMRLRTVEIQELFPLRNNIGQAPYSKGRYSRTGSDILTLLKCCVQPAVGQSVEIALSFALKLMPTKHDYPRQAFSSSRLRSCLRAGADLRTFSSRCSSSGGNR